MSDDRRTRAGYARCLNPFRWCEPWLERGTVTDRSALNAHGVGVGLRVGLPVWPTRRRRGELSRTARCSPDDFRCGGVVHGRRAWDATLGRCGGGDYGAGGQIHVAVGTRTARTTSSHSTGTTENEYSPSFAGDGFTFAPLRSDGASGPGPGRLNGAMSPRRGGVISSGAPDDVDEGRPERAERAGDRRLSRVVAMVVCSGARPEGLARRGDRRVARLNPRGGHLGTLLLVPRSGGSCRHKRGSVTPNELHEAVMAILPWNQPRGRLRPRSNKAEARKQENISACFGEEYG